MLLDVKDGLGQDQTIVVASQEEPADASGILTQANQKLLGANAYRAGWFFQNIGANSMQVNELGADASTVVAAGAGSFVVAPGATWPPPGFPLTTAQINVSGTLGDGFIAREWSTAGDGA